MSRKILYGYQIQNGELIVQPQEAEGVKRIFSLYLEGMTQQQIADALNADGFHYSAESPASFGAVSPAWSLARNTATTRPPWMRTNCTKPFWRVSTN